MGRLAALIGFLSGLVQTPADAAAESGALSRLAYPVALVVGGSVVQIAADEEELRWQSWSYTAESAIPAGSKLIDAAGHGFVVGTVRVVQEPPGMLERIAHGMVNLPLAGRLDFALARLRDEVPLAQLVGWMGSDARAVRRHLERLKSPGHVDAMRAFRDARWKDMHRDWDHPDHRTERSIHLRDEQGKPTYALRAAWIDGVRASGSELRIHIATIYRHQVSHALQRHTGKRVTLEVAGKPLGRCVLPKELVENRLLLNLQNAGAAAAAMRPLLTKL